MRTHARARVLNETGYTYPSNYHQKAPATILPAKKPYFWIGHYITVFRLQAGGSRGQRLSLDSSRPGRLFLIATLYIFIGIAMIKHLPDLLLSSDTLFVPTHPTLSKRLGHYLSAYALIYCSMHIQLSPCPSGDIHAHTTIYMAIQQSPCPSKYIHAHPTIIKKPPPPSFQRKNLIFG